MVDAGMLQRVYSVSASNRFLLKNTKGPEPMFWRRKRHAWYWGVIALLFALRMMFKCASFFQKAADRQARRENQKLSGK
jgi:hypothetical protein